MVNVRVKKNITDEGYIKEIPIYLLDTLETFKKRLAFEIKTLPKYLHFPEELTYSKLREEEITVIDILHLIKQASKGSSIERTFLELLEMIKREDIKLNIRDDVAIIWFGYCKENAVSTKTVDNVINELVKSKVFFTKKYAETYYTSKDILKVTENAIKKLNRDAPVEKENFEKFEEIDIKTTIATEFKPEYTEFKLVTSIRNISLLEVFNSIVLTERIPFATCKNFYKVYKKFVPDKSMEKTTDDSIVLKVMNRNKKNDYTYTDVIVKMETTENDTTVMIIELSIQNTKKPSALNDRTEIEKEVLRIFTLQPTVVNVVEKSVSGYFHIPQRSFNKYIFSDLVMNNDIFEQLVNVDEQKKATKKRTYMYFNHPSTGYITSTITGKYTTALSKKTDYKLAGENLDFFPEGMPYLRVSISVAENTESIRLFQEMLRRLFSIYDEEKETIIADYKKYLPAFGEEENVEDEDEDDDEDVEDGDADDAHGENAGEGKKKRKVKYAKLSDFAPDLFVSDYTRKCNQSRMPSIVSEQEGLRLEAQGKNVMKFPRDRPEKGVVFPSDGDNQQYYVCNHKEHPYVGLKENKLSNSDIYPYTPCCFKVDQSEKDEYKRYFNGEEMKEPKPNKYDIITTGKILKYNKYGTLPSNIESFFSLTDGDYKYEYIRRGMFRNENSFIACVMEAFPNDNNIEEVEKDADVMADYLNRIRENLNQPDLIASCRQELYDLNTDEIGKIIMDLNVYFDPKLFVHMMEELYNCNIFIFSKKSADGDLQLPRHLQSYYKNRMEKDCIYIFEHTGGETDKATYPQCELIVKKQVVEKSANVKSVFSYDEATNVRKLYSVLRNSYALNKPIEEIVFPFETFPFKIISQVIDTYGKTRALNIRVDEEIVSLFVSPIQPIRCPETNKVYYSSKMYTILSVFKKLKIQEQRTQTNKRQTVSGTIGNVSVFMIAKNENNSILELYNFNKKMARYLSEYTFWMFSRFMVPRREKENPNEIIEDIFEFSAQAFKIIKDYSYEHVSKNFSLDSPILQDEKIVVRNKETIRRLIYVLRLKALRDLKTILNYHEKTSITDYYLELSDFDIMSNQKLLFGEESIQKLIDEYKKEYILDNEIKIGNEPYFLKNALIDDNVYVAQNANTLEKAIDIATTWNSFNYNLGIQSLNLPINTSFSLYSYKNPYHIDQLKVSVNDELARKLTDEFANKLANKQKEVLRIREEHPLLEGYCLLTNDSGAQCYMNSLMHFLFSIDTLRIFLREIKMETLKDEIESSQKCHKNDKENVYKVIGALKETFDTFTQKRNQVLSLKDIQFENDNVYNIFLRNANFEHRQQEDSTEFLMSIIGKIDCLIDTNDTIKFFFDSIYHKQNKIFYCLDSDTQHNKEVKSNIVTLSIHPSSTTLQELIENFQIEEEDKDNTRIDECKSKTNPTGYIRGSKIELQSLDTTDYYILSLVRFQGPNKITQKIFPNKILVINNTKYMIKGCVNHVGPSAQRGHYVYSVYENGMPTFVIDDSERKSPYSDDAIAERGYLYLYKKVSDEEILKMEQTADRNIFLDSDAEVTKVSNDIKIIGYKMNGIPNYTTLLPL
jgi:hypothetical protein